MLAAKQVAEGRHVALEASPHSGAWSLQEYQILLQQLHITKHAVCNYGAKVPGRDAMLDQTMQYATSFQMVDCGSCRCGRPLQEHKSLRNNNQVTAIQKNKIEEQLLHGSILRALGLDSGPLAPPATMTGADESRHGQPESIKQATVKPSVSTRRGAGKTKTRTSPGDGEAGDRRIAAGADPRDELLPRHSQSAL